MFLSADFCRKLCSNLNINFFFMGEVTTSSFPEMQESLKYEPQKEKNIENTTQVI